MTSVENPAALLQVLEEHRQYATLVDALRRTGLHQPLGKEPYTLLAPTDSAFGVLKTPVSGLSADELADVLRCHILLKLYAVEQLAKQSRAQNVHGTTL